MTLTDLGFDECMRVCLLLIPFKCDDLNLFYVEIHSLLFSLTLFGEIKEKYGQSSSVSTKTKQKMRMMFS